MLCARCVCRPWRCSRDHERQKLRFPGEATAPTNPARLAFSSHFTDRERNPSGAGILSETLQHHGQRGRSSTPRTSGRGFGRSKNQKEEKSLPRGGEQAKANLSEPEEKNIWRMKEKKKVNERVC